MTKKKKGGVKSDAPSKDEVSSKEADVVAEVQNEPEQPSVSEVGDVEDSVAKKDSKGLSAKERKALVAKAKEIAKKEAKEKAEDDFLKAEVAKAKREEEAKYGLVDPDEEIVRHTVNLSSAADRFLVNGKAYLHGHTYEIPKTLADCLRDMEFRGHEQERIRKGQKINEYGFRNRGPVKAGGGVVSA